MAERAIMPTAASGTWISSCAATFLTTPATWFSDGRWKRNWWQRSMIVAGTLCASVVASTNTTCGGGSSSVFRNAFHACVVHGNGRAVNPAGTGTKAAAHYRLELGAGQSATFRLCLTDVPSSRPFAAFQKTLEARRREADEFYRACTPGTHHHHLICRRCGLTVEIAADAVETWAHSVAAQNGFTDAHHVVDVFGLCAECTRAVAAAE